MDILDESVSLLSLKRNLANFKRTGISNSLVALYGFYARLSKSIRVWSIVYLCTVYQ